MALQLFKSLEDIPENGITAVKALGDAQAQINQSLQGIEVAAGRHQKLREAALQLAAQYRPLHTRTLQAVGGLQVNVESFQECEFPSLEEALNNGDAGHVKDQIEEVLEGLREAKARFEQLLQQHHVFFQKANDIHAQAKVEGNLQRGRVKTAKATHIGATSIGLGTLGGYATGLALGVATGGTGFVLAAMVGAGALATQAGTIITTVDAQDMITAADKFASEMTMIVGTLERQVKALGDIENQLSGVINSGQKLNKVVADWNENRRGKLQNAFKFLQKKLADLDSACDGYANAGQ